MPWTDFSYRRSCVDQRRTQHNHIFRLSSIIMANIGELEPIPLDELSPQGQKKGCWCGKHNSFFNLPGNSCGFVCGKPLSCDNSGINCNKFCPNTCHPGPCEPVPCGIACPSKQNTVTTIVEAAPEGELPPRNPRQVSSVSLWSEGFSDIMVVFELTLWRNQELAGFLYHSPSWRLLALFGQLHELVRGYIHFPISIGVKSGGPQREYSPIFTQPLEPSSSQ